MIPASTTVWHYTNIYPSAVIGEQCSIGSYVEIGPHVQIGDRVRIGAHAFLPEGVTIEDDVFIGPRVTFTNDRYPPSPRERWEPTRVCRGAAIGAGAVILPGVTIGPGARIGAGAVVTRNVPAGRTAFNDSHAVVQGGRR